MNARNALPQDATANLAGAALAAEPGGAPPRASRSAQARELAGILRRSPAFVVGAVVVLFWIADALVWPLFVPYNPQAIGPLQVFKGPSAAHWMGTDDLGRDVLSRVLAGASSVLTVAPLATALGLIGGTAVGLVTGYYRGLVDDIVMRIVDALLAFPIIIIATLVLTLFGSSEVNVILVIGIVFTPIISRTVRSAVLSERDLEYVGAAKLCGASSLYIMVAEILPNITGPIVVEGTVRFGYAIFTSATLSFLTLGVQPPTPDWGLMIATGRDNLQNAPWVVLFPALALATLVVAVNLVADGLKQGIES